MWTKQEGKPKRAKCDGNFNYNTTTTATRTTRARTTTTTTATFTAAATTTACFASGMQNTVPRELLSCPPKIGCSRDVDGIREGEQIRRIRRTWISHLHSRREIQMLRPTMFAKLSGITIELGVRRGPGLVGSNQLLSAIFLQMLLQRVLPANDDHRGP